MFRLSAHDNGLYFFRNRAGVKRCTVCTEPLAKWEEDLASVPIAKLPKHDLSYSYDGVLVATRRFKDAVAAAGLMGMSFRPLQQALFAARPSVVVTFDATRRDTRFEDKCEACGSYVSVIGATPVFLGPGAVVAANGFVRTDLEFGSGDEKTPLVLCGADAAHELSHAKLHGVNLLPA